MARTRTYTATQFIKAIPGSGGIISTIAKRVGCEWHTAKSFIDTYPTVKQVYDNECESVLDLCQSTIIKSIQNGDTGDAKWYLSRKGKDRGFVERSEVTGADGDAIKIKGYAVFSPDDWDHASKD